MQKNVSIPYDLFVALVRYHLAGSMSDEDVIRRGLEEKLAAVNRRTLYQKTLTAETDAAKEEAVRRYNLSVNETRASRARLQ